MMKDTLFVWVFALLAPTLASASGPAPKPVKTVCIFFGYSTGFDHRVRKNVTEFGRDALVVNNGYDFSSKVTMLPPHWRGPEGKFYLAGSTADPDADWASFVLLFDCGLGKFKPVGVGSDWTVIKLIPDTQFTIRKVIGESESSPESTWYLEANCRLTL